MPLTVRKFNAQVKDPQSGQMVPAGLLSSDSLQAIEATESAAITEIQQKGAQTRESIPDDYTELSGSVGELKTQLGYLEYGAVTIAVAGGTAHSSGVDQIKYSLKNGKKYYLSLSSSDFTEAITLRIYGYNGSTGTQIAQPTIKPGEFVEFTSNGNYDAVGLYWNTSWTSVNGNGVFMVYSTDSIYHKTDVASQNSSEALERIGSAEDVVPVNWAYSHVESDWERGTITNQGVDDDSNTRLRNKGYYSIPTSAYIINIECIDTVNCALYFYSDNAFISKTSWAVSTKAVIPEGATRIRIVVRYTNNNSIFTSAIANNLFTLAYTTKLVIEILRFASIPEYDYDSADIGGQSVDISSVKAGFAEIINESGNPSESFFFVTDPHPYYVSDNAQIRKFYATIAKSFYQIPSGFLVSGGDWLTDGMTQDEACEALGYITGVMEHITSGKFYPLLGNHDMNIFGDGEDPTLSYGAIINAMFPVQGSAYYHFNGRSTSFYAIDTGSDHNTVMDAYRIAEMKWLADALTRDNSPHIAILEHIYCTTSFSSLHYVSSAVNDIIAAYNGRTTYTIDGSTYDYSTATGRIEFILAGHTHKEYADYTDSGVAVVVCDRALTRSMIGYDILLVDYENREIKVLRSNTGAVRTLALDEPET